MRQIAIHAELLLSKSVSSNEATAVSAASLLSVVALSERRSLKPKVTTVVSAVSLLSGPALLKEWLALPWEQARSKQLSAVSVASHQCERLEYPALCVVAVSLESAVLLESSLEDPVRPRNVEAHFA